MQDEDAAELRRNGLTLNLHAKHTAVKPPLGASRLDFETGLFLVRGESEGEWALEGRTWGSPPPDAAARWEHEAVFIARQVDPGLRSRIAPPKPAEAA